MKRTRMIPAVAATAAIAMALAACGSSNNNSGGGGSTNNNSGGGGSASGYNAAADKVFNPSDKKGGTLKMANSGNWDSVDPGDTYYGFSWNFLRNYGRSLLTFKSAPGADGNQLVPDLAEGMGVPSDGAKTWTYKIRKGVKYEDGTVVTSKDVKYAVARQLDKDVLPNGPTYFNDQLDLQGYKGPYVDKDLTMANFKAVETPDDNTIVFHLKQPLTTFDYLAMLPATVPVPAAKDTGTKYKEHVMATGPYKFESNEIDKKMALVRNDKYDASTDPAAGRKALPDRIEIQLKAQATDVDNRLLAGQLDVDIAGTGVQTQTQGLVLNNADNKARSDSAPLARLWYTVINPDVAPFDNIDCRKAVEYAVDHVGYQRAYGGPESGGDIATSLTPPDPLIPGIKATDLYDFKGHPNGDPAKAKEELTKCGKPDGFSTNLTYRAERPKEKATAESLQQALNKVGIKTELKAYPQGDYSKLYIGKPEFAKANGLGLMVYGWGADWNEGYGFLQQIVDSRTIRASGNTNINVKIPEVDSLLDQSLAADKSTREDLYNKIDQKVMDNANYVPGLWAHSLLYRPQRLTNVFINIAYGMYDYTTLGVS